MRATGIWYEFEWMELYEPPDFQVSLDLAFVSTDGEEPSNHPPNTPTQPSGPPTGQIDTWITYQTITTDPDGDTIKYGWDWNSDGIVDEWTNYFTSGVIVSISHTWTTAGTYNIQVKAEDSQGARSAFSPQKAVVITSNNPPAKPSPTGPSRGRQGRSNNFTSSSTDPDGDHLSYWFEWGDGTNSGWIGPFISGQSASASHIWTAQGTYSVSVTAKDIYGVESVWSYPISLSIPKNRPFHFLPLWFKRVIEQQVV